MVSDNSRLVRLLSRSRPDVVHLNTSGQLAFVRDALMSVLLGFFRVPFVYHLRFGRVPQMIVENSMEWRLAKFALGRASAVIALDPATEQALRASGVPRRVLRVPNPIPNDRFVETDSGDEREDVVLFVGWVIPAKGVGELLDAWQAIDRKDWSLEIAGPVDDDYLKTLEQQGIPAGANIMGNLENSAVLDRMRRVKMFVLPSHTEGFPNAVLEAMASGAAVVATSVGAIPDMLREGAGVVVSPKQPQELAAAISSLIEEPSRARELGQKAAASARSRFALSEVFEEYLAVWESAMIPVGDNVRTRGLP